MTIEMAERFAELMAPHAGAAGAGEHKWGCLFDVEAPDHETAHETALDIVLDAASRAGLPSWPIVRVEILTLSELERDQERLQKFLNPELVGLAELVEMLGVNSRQRAHRVAQNRGFPDPVAELAMGPVWRREQIAGYVAKWRGEHAEQAG